MEEIVSGLLNVAVKPHADFDTLQKTLASGVAVFRVVGEVLKSCITCAIVISGGTVFQLCVFSA